MGLDIVGKAFDYANEGFLSSGKLEKAKLIAFKEPNTDAKADIHGKGSELELFLNPATITVGKSLKIETTQDSGPGTNETRAAATEPIKFEIGSLWFDTYGDKVRESVRTKYIDWLEGLLDFVPGTHHPPAVTFVWGKFAEAKPETAYFFWVKGVNVTYHMFLPDGTPVRAEVKLTLEQALQKDKWIEQPESPDHAKLYTVRRGDTLQAIAMSEYDDPREWRRIADANQIVDPMALRPGTKLLVPPIL